MRFPAAESTAYYDELGVKKDADEDEIKKAYKKLAMKWHPDRHKKEKGGDEDSAKLKFQKIQQAFQTLSDKRKRHVYDHFGEEGLDHDANGMPPNGGPPFGPNGPNGPNGEPSVDMFANMFGNMHMGGPMGAPPGFDMGGRGGFGGPDAFGNPFMGMGMGGVPGMAGMPGGWQGGEMGGGYNGNAPNNAGYGGVNGGYGGHFGGGKGGGGKGGYEFGGKGGKGGNEMWEEKAKDTLCDLEVTLEELFNGASKAVKVSRKRHQKKRENGAGMHTEEKELKVEVKKGWKAGTKLTYEGQGDEQPDSPPGSVVVVIKEKPHENFKRVGNDLYLTVQVPLREALCGGTLEVSTIDENTLKIDYDDVIQPGSTKRFLGEGMPISKAPGTRGDLIITFEVVFPASLTEQQRATVWETLPVN